MSVAPIVHSVGPLLHRHPGVVGVVVGVFTAVLLVAVGIAVGVTLGLALVSAAGHLGLPVPHDSEAILRQLIP